MLVTTGIVMDVSFPASNAVSGADSFGLVFRHAHRPRALVGGRQSGSGHGLDFASPDREGGRPC